MRAARVAIAAAVLAGASMPARAASTAIVAGPGSTSTGSGYTTQVVVTQAGDPLRLINADLFGLHDARSVVAGSDDASWCGPLDPAKPEGPANPRRYARGACPLFFADLAVPLGGTSPVLGTDRLEQGRSYAFTCEITAGMRGLLIVG
jgi:hypothetical protein